VVAVRDHFENQTDVLPVVVTFTDDPSRLTAYRDHLGLDVPVLADTERQLYDLLGAGRGALRQVWSPGTMALYARLLLRGRRLRTPTEDTRQLGADAIVGHDGRLRRVWLPAGPDRRPPVGELASTLDELRR